MSDKQPVAGERGMYTRPGADRRVYFWARVSTQCPPSAAGGRIEEG